MKLKIAILALLPATMFITSCGVPATEQVAVIQTKNGAAIVETVQTTGVVTGVYRSNRKITLKFDNGASRTVKAGPDVANFSQIKVGDHVTAAVTEEFAVFIGKGAPPSASGAAAIALAPIGAKPGVYMADSVQMTAKITGINAKKRTVTLDLPNQGNQTVKVSDQVNLGAIKVGDDVTIQVAEAMALVVTKA